MTQQHGTRLIWTMTFVLCALPATAQGPLPQGYVPNDIFGWNAAPSHTTRTQGRAKQLRGERQTRHLSGPNRPPRAEQKNTSDLEFGGEINFGMTYALPSRAAPKNQAE